MNTIEKVYKMQDQYQIYGYKWENKRIDPIGMVLLSHGMSEHIKRYEDFAENLTKVGYIVYGHDQRGHGKSGETIKELGYFSKNDGFNKVVTDLEYIADEIQKEHSDLPLFLFGHSMGSFVVRRLIQTYQGNLAGAIISGTGFDPGLQGSMGSILASSVIKTGKGHLPNKLLTFLSFGSFNRGFKPTETDFDWLSRDINEVYKYIEDPLCGFFCSSTFYRDLFFGLKTIHIEKEINRIPKKMPIFIISGGMDPVGGQVKGVQKVVEQYEKAGLSDVKYHYYQDARHELLHEINRDEVIEDIITWLHDH
jgi:alpha-beta hydrolase superfamily lysophospholipase